MKRLLEKAWAPVALAFVVGIALTYFFHAEGAAAPLHHIGIGLLVAATVTGFWHLREFSEFFEKFASTVLLDDEYLKKLSLESLTALRSRVAHVILEARTDNPNYRHHELGVWIDRMLFDALLPSKKALSGVYRQGYKEQVILEYLTLEKALGEVGCDTTNLPSDQLKSKVLKVIAIARYTLIAPRIESAQYKEYPVGLKGNGANLPGFPLQKRVELLVGRSEKDASPCSIEFCEEDEGGITYEAKDRLLSFANGECEVWTKSTEYQSPERQPHVLNMMAILTCGLKVNLYQIGAGPRLVFDGDVIATGNADDRSFPPGGAELEYTGWLFEGHGYHLWWWVN